MFCRVWNKRLSTLRVYISSRWNISEAFRINFDVFKDVYKDNSKSFLKKHKIHCYSLCDLNYRNKDVLVVFSNYLLNLSFKSLTYVKFVWPTLSRFSPISIHTLLSQNVLSIENYSWCHFPLYGRFVISLSLLIFSAYLRFVIRDWTSHL